MLGLVGAISSNSFALAAPTPLAASLKSRGRFCGKRGMRFAHRANPLDIAPYPAQARIFDIPGYPHWSACLSLRERWQRHKPLTERGFGTSCLIHTPVSFMLRDVREAVPYICPLNCIVNCQLSIVNFPQPFTFHL